MVVLSKGVLQVHLQLFLYIPFSLAYEDITRIFNENCPNCYFYN